jgi:hypothetical protein
MGRVRFVPSHIDVAPFVLSSGFKPTLLGFHSRTRSRREDADDSYLIKYAGKLSNTIWCCPKASVLMYRWFCLSGVTMHCSRMILWKVNVRNNTWRLHTRGMRTAVDRSAKWGCMGANAPAIWTLSTGYGNVT